MFALQVAPPPYVLLHTVGAHAVVPSLALIHFPIAWQGRCVLQLFTFVTGVQCYSWLVLVAICAGLSQVTS